MRWVDIPYQETNDKLLLQNVEWPPRCPCCGMEHGNDTYIFGTRAVKSTTYHSNTSKSETYYPVSFTAPYCAACKQHAGVFTKTIYLYVIGFFLWLGLGWILFINELGDTYTILIALLAAGLIGSGCYFASKSIINKYSRSRMSPTCANHNYALNAFHRKPNIRIQFNNDTYAADFARVNNLQMFMPVDETIES